MAAATLDRIAARGFKKGDVLGVAQLAGIMGAKRTADLIPLCHPLPLTAVTVELEPRAGAGLRRGPGDLPRDRADRRRDGGADRGRVAALTVYDMCKAVDRGMRITDLHLVHKAGGRSGEYPGGRLRCCRSPRRRPASWPRCAPTPVEWVALPQALGRVLAADLHRTPRPAAGRGLGHGRLRGARRRHRRDRAAAPAGRRGRRGRRSRPVAVGAGRGGAHLHRRRGARRCRCHRHPGECARPTAAGAVHAPRSRPGRSCARPGSTFAAGWTGLRRRAPGSTRGRSASPPPWATSGCRCGDGRASACWPPATSCAGPARRPTAARSSARTR